MALGGSNKKVYGVNVHIDDYARRQDGTPFDRDDYLQHGIQKYTSIFHERVRPLPLAAKHPDSTLHIDAGEWKLLGRAVSAFNHQSTNQARCTIGRVASSLDCRYFMRLECTLPCPSVTL
jgi:hypothetical protein